MSGEDKMNAELTVEQKIANIRNCTDYRQMAWDWFPPAHADEYYFVSYSHKDYKEVFEDIYALQGQGLHIWYDRELRPGKDWEIEARAHIYDFKCKSVIFYIGENSVASDSIHREIEFVKRSGKSYLSINLPVNGEYLSAAEILRRVQPELGEDDEKYKTLEETFNDKVTYLKLSEEPFARAQRIKSSLVSLPLLRFVIEKDEDGNKLATVTGINDINATVVKEEDFICRDESGKIVPVIKIGAAAFANCRYLSKIELSKKIRYIGRFAFYNCIILEKINLPKGLAAIETEAFCECSNLKSIYIPMMLTLEIGEQTFKGCKSLEYIEVDSNNRVFFSQDGILYYIVKEFKIIHVPQAIKGKITILDRVTSIQEGAFYHREKITSITIPNSVTSIGEEAFSHCVNLESVNFGNESKLTSIGVEAFDFCEKLKSLILPDSVVSIGNRAFSYCRSLASITIPNSVTKIYGGAFEDCTSLTNITIPNGVTEIGEYVFRGCTSLESIEVVADNPKYASQDGILYNKTKTRLIYVPCGKSAVTIHNGVKEIGENSFFGCTLLTSITIPNGVTEIRHYAFERCTSLESITIPNSVTEIGNGAFLGCTSLKSITISNSVTEIGKRVFSGCTSLKNITIPNSVIKVNKLAFEGCTSLKSITISDGVPEISEEAFLGCTALESIEVVADNPNYASQDGILYNKTKTKIICVPCGKSAVTIPNSVTEIGSYAFLGCTALTSITIPNSVTKIGGSAFKNTAYYNDNANWVNMVLYIDNHIIDAKVNILGAYDIVSGTKTIADSAFEGCSSLKSITIPNSVTELGEYAFAGCTLLKSITIPHNVTEIGDGAFLGCTSLESIELDIHNPDYSSQDGILYNKDKTEIICVPCRKSAVTIPNSVIEISAGAFYGCTSLISITIPHNVTELGNFAFSGCTSLTSIIIPNSVTEISDGAFSGCTSLTSITIPNSITVIGRMAFYVCTSLKEIKYQGTIEQLKTIEFYVEWDEDMQKYISWDKDMPNYIIYCKDGEIHKDGTVIRY